MVLLFLFVFMFSLVPADAAWKTDWKYGPGDLADPDCLQNAIDDLDGRLDAIGASSADTNINANVTAKSLKGQQAASQTLVSLGTATVSSVVCPLNSSGGAYGTTNAIVLTRPTSNQVAFIINSGATNKLSFAQSGSWNSRGMVLNSNGDAVVVIGLANADGPGTNAWYAVGVNSGQTTTLSADGTNWTFSAGVLVE